MKLLPDAARDLVKRIRDARLANPGKSDSSAPVVSENSPIAKGLDITVQATRFAVVTAFVAIALTIASIMAGGMVQTTMQYLSTLGFVLAWAATSAGIYSRSAQWLRDTCLKSVKWWAFVFVPVAVINLFQAAGQATGT
ncbi:hypothetical protein [Sciscionella sediminilitoris]|uniref:hypothetical protein n=1 Tax=Sciscionella sediminilitoris TaxID=1445613 RepID=UPI0012E22589|nr:hypothetical protein [Sciscionella sp. SE31]